MTVEHAEVWNYDGHGKSNDQYTTESTKWADDEARVGLGHHVAIAHCGHGDHCPP